MEHPLCPVVSREPGWAQELVLWEVSETVELMGEDKGLLGKGPALWSGEGGGIPV